MTAITGLDLPAGSPGGSVELLWDLYLGSDPLVTADAFMLAAGSNDAGSDDAGSCGAGSDAHGPVLLDVPGKQLDGPGFQAYVEDLAAAIRRRFRPADYGIVHLQHLAFGATPALLRAFPHHPSLALVHGTDLLFAADHPTQAGVLREAAAVAGAVVVPTTAMGDLLLRIADVDPRRIVHIPWGVPDHLLAAPTRRERSTDGGLRLLYAGRLTAEKGADSLIEAAVRLDGATLSLAAPEADFRALAGRTDVAAIRYLGWLSRRQLWRSFADHDVLVVPSNRLEAFSLVAVEAQACGVPVVYQPVPGLTEVLGDSALAVDLSPGARGLADTAAWLTKDPAALDEVRAAGYRNAARFPLSRTARELLDLSARLER